MLISTLFLASLPSWSAAVPIYVDDSTSGPVLDGSTWCQAYRYLQDGLAAAKPGDEVRVANGTYTPDRGADQARFDREASFHLPDGVRVLGGYAGCGAPDPNYRNPHSSGPILSGDLNHDDATEFANRSDNSYHVVTLQNVGSDSVFEQFEIRGGYADGAFFPHSFGGGIYIDGGAPTVMNVMLRENWADFNGGGIYEFGSTATIWEVLFSSNKAGYGGGMFAGGSVSVQDCHFFRNSALADGGGLYVNTESAAVIVNTVFSTNSAGFSGGGISTSLDTQVTLDHCIAARNVAVKGAGMSLHGNALVTNSYIFGNDASDMGGGIEFNSFKALSQVVVNSTIVGNTGGNSAGGILYFNFGTRQSINSSILYGNSANGDSLMFAQLMGDFQPPIMEYNCIQGFPGTDAAGNIGDDPQFITPVYDFTTFVVLPNFRLRPESPAIDAGDPETLAIAGLVDLDRHGRVLCGRVDIGVYEFGIGDVNCDKSVDLDDFTLWDYCEADAKAQQIPDDCRPLDFNDTQDVNLFDFAGFQRAFAPWP